MSIDLEHVGILVIAALPVFDHLFKDSTNFSAKDGDLFERHDSHRRDMKHLLNGA
jgi:hypothetical protein